VRRNELAKYLDQLLDVSRFEDYCPNGLQVEGQDCIHTLITGVTASLDLLRAAFKANADAILVHHGYFWRGENPCLTGLKYHRIKQLVMSKTSLFAYHLPLDAHQEIGNNTQLGRRLGLLETSRFGAQNIGSYGKTIQPLTLDELEKRIAQVLSRTPMIISSTNKTITRIAWCTGAAQSYFEEAIDLGIDAFITGEISEQTVHIARESGVILIAAGHHATERYGVQALGEHLAQKFRLTHQFIDIDNPV